MKTGAIAVICVWPAGVIKYLIIINMGTENIPFQIINWDEVAKTTHPGTTGTAFWQTLQFKGLRVRV